MADASDPKAAQGRGDEPRVAEPASSLASLGQWQRHHPRKFDTFTYAYPVLSRRSGGLSIGVNLNLDKLCNFDCPYCQVDRRLPGLPQRIDLAQLRDEVEALLQTCDRDGICRLERFAAIADANKVLRDVALSGDGEPTMVPAFSDVVASLAELQKRPEFPPFKLVLITNATLLDKPKVIAGIDSLMQHAGAVWAKLDAGTEAYYQSINVSRIHLDTIENNLKLLGSRHPFTVQSFFCRLNGEAPPSEEIDAYLERLRRVKDSGARIEQVQVYSLARPPAEALCQPLETSHLQAIADRIHTLGIPATVYGTAD